MDTRVKFGKSTTLEIPPASLSSFDTISIIVLIPLYDQGLVPLLKRCKMRITVLQRIGVGLVLATVSMVVAGVVEMRRLRLAHQGRFTPDGSVDMSVFWQTFQVRKKKTRLFFFDRLFDGCLSIARADRVFKRSFQQLVFFNAFEGEQGKGICTLPDSFLIAMAVV